MNKIIPLYSHANMRASFKTYLIYIGVDEEDPRLKLLKSPKKRASSLNSIRLLGDKVITKKDLKIFFSELEQEWQLIVGFLYDTGCREDEMLSLRWKGIEFIDPKDGIYAEVEVMGKGHKKRTVYLTKTTVNLLKLLRPDIKNEDKVFVFRMKDGKLYARQEKALIDGMRKRTKKFLGKAYTPHAFRHTKLTHLAENGADILGVSSYAGHSDIKVTQIYVKMSNRLGKNAFQNFSEDIQE